MVKPAFTQHEQTLLGGSLLFLSIRQPQRTPDILDSLDSMAGPVLADALTVTIQAWVDFRPQLEQLITDLTNLVAKVKASA